MATISVRVPENQRLQLGGKCIEVLVGPEEETFMLHETLVRTQSRFFNNAMSREWKESAERRIRLPSESPDIFSLYQNWIYARKIPTALNEPGRKGHAEYIRLSQAYCLGEMLMDTTFKDAIVDAIISKAVTPAADDDCWYPDGKAIGLIYDGTPKDSPARELLVAFYHCCGDSDWITKEDDLPKDFLMDLTIALLDGRPKPEDRYPWKLLDTCQWHSHGKETACYKG
ncbi:hypothetical protein AOQ84DRAFT_388851 [Glonium stellatum]|uniref:BTB domain-containing protein n=1 Tax=Glonium stellatum TaxID=574774 RepID=A0A8E2F0R5_9PEZI|nr:hypothetical protein AOQ84DRAFT_388851 [Glonium stellatum]